MTFLTSAFSRLRLRRPDAEASSGESGANYVMCAVLLLIFAPIFAAHVAFMMADGAATAAPAAVERTTR